MANKRVRILEPGSDPAGQSTDPVLVIAPVLAGFTLAAIVILATTGAQPQHPLIEAATACFVASAIALVFALQLIGFQRALAERGRASAGVVVTKALLFEAGLLLLLIGLGLFLWPRRWTAAAAIEVALSFLAALTDVVGSVVFMARNVSHDPVDQL